MFLCLIFNKKMPRYESGRVLPSGGVSLVAVVQINWSASVGGQNLQGNLTKAVISPLFGGGKQFFNQPRVINCSTAGKIASSNCTVLGGKRWLHARDNVRRGGGFLLLGHYILNFRGLWCPTLGTIRGSNPLLFTSRAGPLVGGLDAPTCY